MKIQKPREYAKKKQKEKQNGAKTIFYTLSHTQKISSKQTILLSSTFRNMQKSFAALAAPC
jgi:hypothetical protein